MNLKTFIFGLLVTFGLPWVIVIAMPYASLLAVKPVQFDKLADEKTGDYNPKVTGQVQNGQIVYSKNGCYICHTQLVRPTYAGADMWRSDWAGKSFDQKRGDTRRESTIFDYLAYDYAQVGLARNGPDLSNFGHRATEYAKDMGTTPEHWILMHLYNPRHIPNKADWSFCPSQKQFFETKPQYGDIPKNAVSALDGEIVVPKGQAIALASYLANLKRDDALPKSISHAPAQTESK